MPGRISLHRAKSVLSAEVAAIRRRDPDLDPGDLTQFTFPLLVRLLGVLAVGVVPLIVVRSGDAEDSLLVPLIGSAALVIICTAVVAWLTAVVISGLVVMVLYRTGPAAASRLVARTLVDSFERISDSTSHITLLALVAGLSRWRSGCPPATPTNWPTRYSTTCWPHRSVCCSRHWVWLSSRSRRGVPPTSSTINHCCWRGRGPW